MARFNHPSARCLTLLLSLVAGAPPNGRTFSTAADAAELALTPKGKQLAELLDSLKVETRWRAGQHITRWRTGHADGKTGGPRTHCSLFVAAVCWRLHAPMLEPPPQLFLSNRQQDWLTTQGKAKGWRRVKDPLAAQRLANRGTLVIASYKNPRPKRAGHIAVVRPAAVTARRVRERGPRITQAGARNYRDTDVRTGFRNHRGAWEKGRVLFFAYRPSPE
jgi:hypothetical protein